MTDALARASAHPHADIRRCRPDDWAALREVRLTALADAPEAFGSTLDRELGYDEQRWRGWIESAAVFLAWRNGRPDGMVAGFANEPDRPDSVPHSWHLVAMWVSPQMRGLGVAAELVGRVARHAHGQDAASLVLWVTDVNPRARAFYQRLGFRSTGVRQPVRPTEPDHWEEQFALRLG